MKRARGRLGPAATASAAWWCRQRLLIAGGTLAGLAGLIAVVLALSGGEEHSFERAPAACTERWNSDRTALALGKHQFSIHRYQRVEVTYLTGGGEKPARVDTRDARCSIVFSAAVLDAELSATVQTLRPAAGWGPLSGAGVPRDRLGELQSEAQGAYNALLQPDGAVEPLS